MRVASDGVKRAETAKSAILSPVRLPFVLHEVLDIHFRTPSTWPKVAGESTGTNVRRRRLNPEDFLDYEMPLPSRETQMMLGKVRAEVDAVSRLQDETAAELDALLPAILDRAFKGEL